MLFMWGMFAANIVRKIMEKLNISYLINNAFQSRVTGFFSDYLVVSSFMAIQVGVIGKWIVPIIIAGAVSCAATFLVSLYFGERLGSDHADRRRLFSTLFKGYSQQDYDGISEAIDRLYGKDILLHKSNCIELNFEKMSEIREILGR